LLALVHVSFALRKRTGTHLARRLHLLAYPAFVALTLHAAWLGHGQIGPLYLLGSLTVAAALSARLVTLAGR
jgi:methionine sulfoxide reductase heme-binding subunit